MDELDVRQRIRLVKKNSKRPIFGLLSIGLPLFGLSVEIASILVTPNLWRPPDPGDTAIIRLVYGTLALGLVSGIAGFARGERLKHLPKVGILFNLVLIAFSCQA